MPQHKHIILCISRLCRLQIYEHSCQMTTPFHSAFVYIVNILLLSPQLCKPVRCFAIRILCFHFFLNLLMSLQSFAFSSLRFNPPSSVPWIFSVHTFVFLSALIVLIRPKKLQLFDFTTWQMTAVYIPALAQWLNVWWAWSLD